MHARKFQRLLDKLTPDQAVGRAEGKAELPKEFMEALQKEIAAKFTEMLQHIRYSWLFQKDGIQRWQLMDQAIEKMKQLGHFAEDVAGNGLDPRFKVGQIDMNTATGQPLNKALADVRAGLARHLMLQKDGETQKHGGFAINLGLTCQQEGYQVAEIGD